MTSSVLKANNHFGKVTPFLRPRESFLFLELQCNLLFAVRIIVFCNTIKIYLVTCSRTMDRETENINSRDIKSNQSKILVNDDIPVS